MEKALEDNKEMPIDQTVQTADAIMEEAPSVEGDSSVDNNVDENVNATLSAEDLAAMNDLPPIDDTPSLKDLAALKDTSIDDETALDETPVEENDSSTEPTEDSLTFTDENQSLEETSSPAELQDDTLEDFHQEENPAEEPVATTSEKIEGTLEELTQRVEAVKELIQEEETVPSVENQPMPPVEQVRRTTNYSPMLVVHHNRGDRITEEYRSLRTAILARCPEDRFCFLVTSAEQGEGKTVSCLNLALVMTEKVDCRTVVVDLDLRKGAMAGLLGASNDLGVAECLSGKAAMSDIIQPTAYPNLSFIPAGRTEKLHAGELLSRGELKKMIAWLRQKYDFVLLDTPAINHFSDAGMAGLAAGEALLVVQANKTKQESVTQAITALQNANVSLIGVLMTHWRHRFFS